MDAIKRIWGENTSLRWFMILTFVCLSVALAETFICSGSTGRQSYWIKACKFSVSLFAYSATLAWMSGYLQERRHFFHRLLNVVAAGSAVELLVVSLQALLHENTSGSVGADVWLFPLARVAILPVAAAMPVAYFLLWRQADLPAVLSSAMRWGVALTLVGFIPGFLMLIPGTGHPAGLPTVHQYSAGSTLPLLGWSTRFGDLRAAHFVGIHALQILPLAGSLIIALGSKFTASTQKLVVACLGVSYLSTICMLTWQALRAESLVAPSTLTMETFFGSLLAGIVFTTWAFRQGTLLGGPRGSVFSRAYQTSIGIAERLLHR